MAAKKKATTTRATRAAPRRGSTLGGNTLVIVESPTKARTIGAFLPDGYRVEASFGHVRDLPGDAKEIPAKYKGAEWARLGVNVDDGFDPLYVIPAEKRARVKELKAALADADELLLATDEDREGESISWHLLSVLEPRVPVRRMVFHEITKEAIRDALEHTREIDDKLVRAQETRRILDRLVGYTVSPLLWKKVAWGLSAGRVQSVAAWLVVARERERRAFRAGTYWDLVAQLRHAGQGFRAELVAVGGKRIATGKDFDENTGRIAAGKDVLLLDEARARALEGTLSAEPWVVASAEEKPFTRRPSPPFTTSTLQQEANRKFRWSARDTMRVAQSLYENGFITYMRTDSVFLSDQAVSAARTAIRSLYGAPFLPDAPRRYQTKSANAQEAHEAIRPAGAIFRTPEDTGLSGRDFQLYDLIWKRTVASQMVDARQTSLVVQLAAADTLFRASGKRIDFPGFLRAYVEGSDDPDAALEDQEVILPPLAEGDRPACEQVSAVSHVTQPPARYTEASLVKVLETEGIGRPSTYATIIDTLIDRGYVLRQGQALVPTFTAFAVTGLLEKHLPELVNVKFTAGMEEKLDEISRGEREWKPYLEEFYLGDTGLRAEVVGHEADIDPAEARTVALEGLDAVVKIGRFGPYVEVERDGEPLRASIPKDAAPADLDQAQVETLLRQKIDGPDELGKHPETGEPIFLLTGQYGPYLQLGPVVDGAPKPKRTSLPRGLKPEDVTLDAAVKLLGLPRRLGEHPTTRRPVFAGLGRFGPYVVHEVSAKEKEYRSLKAEDDVLTVELGRALELLSMPKQGRGRRVPEPVRIVGAHPADGEPIGLYAGQYGPYVKHGDVSASIPKDADPDSVTLEQAVDLIAARAAIKGGGRRKGARRASGGAAAAAKPKKGAKRTKAAARA
ncbi:MAG: type I DNA topoisomerase [Gemmatimonadales bacterium]|nr:type I DNA topoisomerase [Gemmatimonadales bacterium]